MKVNIVGFTRLTGTSKKTGNPYDFYTVAVTYKAESGYNGVRVRELTASPDIFESFASTVAKLPLSVEIDTDFAGKNIYAVYI